MTQKQQTIDNVKPWPQVGSFGSFLHEIVTNLRNLVEVPTGYQDESGFHYGPEPVRQESQSRSR